MARILSVSYDVSLLGTRRLILQDQGHAVISALGFTEALEECRRAAGFDLFILGHSIPHSDKEALISAFRAHSAAPIVALRRQSEKPVLGANFEIEPDPEAVVNLVTRLVASKVGAAD